MDLCKRCGPGEPGPVRSGELHLSIPFGHTSGKLQSALKDAGYAVKRRDDLVLVDVEPGQLQALSALFNQATSAQERDMIRALFVERGKTLTPSDYFSIDSLERTLGRLRSGWLNDAIAAGNITSVFQPIVYAADPARVFAYESLLRVVEDGKLTSPAAAFAVARQADVYSMLDQVARRSAITQAKRFGVTEHLFINFSPTSIYDPVFCLRSTLKTLEECGIHHDRVVFEVVESERIDDFEHLAQIMRFYREQGLGVALDDLGSGYGSLELLHRLQPDYVKIDMHFIQNVDRDPYKSTICSKLIDTAAGLGVKVIAEGIERGEEADWLRARGVDFLQGYYFAKPGLPPPLQSV